MNKLVITGKKENGEAFRREIAKDIQALDLSERQLSSIDLSPLQNCPKLQWLFLSMNQLTSVDLSPLKNCHNLQHFFLNINQLTSVDLSPLKKCQQLQELVLFGNQLSSVDLSPLENCQQLQILFLSDNQLSTIDLSPLKNCQQLQKLYLHSNQLASVDLSPLENCQQLQEFYLDDSVTILWEQKNLKGRRLSEGLQSLEAKIQQAHQNYLAEKEQQLERQRSEKLRKILSKFQEISLERMGKMLDFTDSDELLDWLLEVPNEFGIQIKDEMIIFTKNLRNGSSEAEIAINNLLKKFEEFERKNRGKKN
ncbi:MAG: leucine-rich repeat protein [Candidatus Heimdallarchaeota archaeon]|nr:leucine-rich repeat protein [Candidatus Heimdallarchaeota archaeon]